MQKIPNRFDASSSKHRKTAIAWLLPFMLIGSSHALAAGSIGTIYNGALPPDAQRVCYEGSPSCSVQGIREVWYGAQNWWIYKLVSGTFPCTNENFLDLVPGKVKGCYARDLTMPAVMPPALPAIPLEFDLSDLLTVQKGRYTFSVIDGNVRREVKTSRMPIVVKAIPGPQRLQQNYFQFDITDSASPIRQYSIFISPTFSRCLTFRPEPPVNVVGTYGRIVEIHSMTTLPTMQMVPQRSDVQKVCTNDKGQLKFNLKPPSIDSFQIKVVNYEASGKPNDVFDFFVPINFDWMKR